jgi:LmbE family N-acetylglucosaminyl deacetylase
MKVLAVGCHPDDLEISCGGTLAKLVKQGHQVTMCHVASGDKGHVIIPPEQLKEIRAQEGKNAGHQIGAEVVSLGIPDLEVRADDGAFISLLVDLIRRTEPDYMITHSPNDYMKDHLEVSKAVFDASFSSSVPHYKTENSYFSKIPAIYYMDNLAGVNFHPTEYVNISETIEAKIRMVDCHQSQVKWMKDHDHIDFLDFVRTVSKFRGLQSGVPYAEGFTQCQVWPRLTTVRLLP